LIGSHIKQWSKSSATEREDKNNGLLLCVTHDALFDRFLISFSDNGHIIYSDALPQDAKVLLNLTDDIRIKISKQMKPYLLWHRERLKKSDD
jgi:predicted restriction endonuclease